MSSLPPIAGLCVSCSALRKCAPGRQPAAAVKRGPGAQKTASRRAQSSSQSVSEEPSANARPWHYLSKLTILEQCTLHDDVLQLVSLMPCIYHTMQVQMCCCDGA
jgi:hypothetical protein